MNAEDEKTIERWFLIRELSSGTEESYRIAIRDYSNLIGKSPTELMEEADEEEERGVRPTKTNALEYILRYKKHLKEKGIAPGTLTVYISAIKSFYKAYGITLPEIRMEKGDIGLEKNIGKPLNRDIIQQLISTANHRERALIYLMALSGMGQQEARDLTIRKIIDASSTATGLKLKNVYDLFQYENQILNEVLTLEITRKKVNYRHHTFMPPEASREMISYLRERCYGRNENIRVKDNNDTVFVNNQGNKLSRDSIVTNFRRIGEQAGFSKEKGSYSYWRSHSLRKYFITTIINKVGEKTLADYMAGHKISNQDRTYWQANPEDLKNHYLKALPYLSIDEAKIKDFQSKEYRELKEDVSNMKKDMGKDMAKIKKILEDPMVREAFDKSMKKNESNI